MFIRSASLGATRPLALFFAAHVVAGVPVSQAKTNLGRTATAQEITGWDTFVAPDGKGLPAGRGSVSMGKALYAERCAGCHGEFGEGLAWEGKSIDRLAGGQGTLATALPVKTIGSFWPYATTLFSYVAAAMPFMTPQSLRPDEVYALTAFLLHINGIIKSNAVLDAKSLPKVEMPNRHGFKPDPRPDVPSASHPAHH